MNKKIMKVLYFLVSNQVEKEMKGEEVEINGEDLEKNGIGYADLEESVEKLEADGIMQGEINKELELNLKYKVDVEKVINYQPKEETKE